jgi:hypothetical protein
MKLTFAVLLVLAAACGKVNHPGGGTDGGPGGGGDGGGGGGGDGGDLLDAGPISQITVTLDVGSGGGAVASDSGNIDCGTSCETMVDTGTEITLTATPEADSAFVAWRGDAKQCRRNPECTITVDRSKTIEALFAKKGTAGWAFQIGSSVNDGLSQVVADKNGDLFVAAAFSGAFEFFGQSFDTVGSSDIFLAKLTPGGEVLWAKAFGGANYDSPAFIAADPTSGDLVVGGYYQSEIDFGGPDPLGISDSEDMFVVKLAADNGALVWQVPIAVSDNDGPGFEGLGVDPNGGVTVGGHFNTSINLGGADLTSVDQEMFLAKLHGDDGSLDWQRKLGGTNYPIPTQLVVDGNGNAIWIGYFSDTVDFDGVAGNDMTALGFRDAFVAKFSGANGSLVWQRQIGGTDPNDGGGSDDAHGIALGPNNSVVVVIRYRVVTGESVRVLGNTLSGTGTGMDLVVGRISAAGGFVWAKRWGGAGNEYGYKVGTFQDGRVAVTGNFYADFSMDSETLSHAGSNSDSFFAVLAAANGNTIWAKRVGCPTWDFGTSVVGWDDQVIGAGNFQADGTFLGKMLSLVGSTDAYGFVVPLP